MSMGLRWATLISSPTQIKLVSMLLPLVGNLPGLSWLFSRRGTSVQNRKILILIRARIVLMEEAEPLPETLPGNAELTMGR